MLDFPSSPNVGQVVTLGGITWTWDGVKWTAAGTGAGIYVPLTGGTMTGDLILNRDAQLPLGAATLEQVNARGAGDNRLINGDMRIDARNNGASGSANGYTVDRWQYASTQVSKGTWQRVAYNGLGFPYALSFFSSSAYTPLTGDTFLFVQLVEADMVSDFQWGSANAQSVTLSFVAQSTLTGTFGGSIRNGASTRSYPFTYSIPTANVPTKISIIISGDTAGTWVMSGNAAGLMVGFDLGTGATYRGPAGAWAGQQYNGATGTVNVVSTNGAFFYITGVKLEIGSVATPFNRQSLAKSLADCQRYYQKLGGGGTTADIIITGYAAGPGSANAVSSTIGVSAMRANPTAALVGTWAAAINISATNLFGGLSTLGIQIFPAAAGPVQLYTAGNTSTYISLSAEL